MEWITCQSDSGGNIYFQSQNGSIALGSDLKHCFSCVRKGGTWVGSQV